MNEQAEQEMTVQEAARHFGVTDRAITKWIAQGHFPNAYRTSPNPRSPFKIPVSDIKAFDKARRRR